jgi:hypothetical protein
VSDANIAAHETRWNVVPDGDRRRGWRLWAGRWTLSIDKVGWRILDPSGHGALIDVAYLSTGTLEACAACDGESKVWAGEWTRA